MSNLLIKLFIKDHENINDAKVRKSYGFLGGIFGIICSSSLFILKFFIGTLTGSIAVTADAFNNLSDVASSVVTMLGFQISSKPPDLEHPFGHGRAEYLSSLIVSTIIILVGFELFTASINKTVNPEPVETSATILFVLAISILVKLYQGLFCRKLGKAINSSALLATSRDSLNDCISTFSVILSLIAGNYVTFNIDGYMGIIVAIFILRTGYSIILETIDTLLGKPATIEFAELLTSKVLEFDGVIGFHDLVVHDYGAGRKIASIHAEMPDTYDFNLAHEISDNVERTVSKEMGIFLTVHIDPVSLDTDEVLNIKNSIDDVINACDKELSYHDLRIISTKGRTNVLMDIVLTKNFSSKEKQEELQNILFRKLNETDNKYDLTIEFDMKYY